MDKINVVIGGVNIEMEKEEISRAIEKGELKIESDQIIAKSDDQIVYEKEEFETFKSNLANDEYKKGKTAGVEMTIKDAREKFNLEFEGKTIDNFADAFKDKVLKESSVKPNEKIQELETDKKKLQDNYSQLENDFAAFKNQVTDKEKEAVKKNAFISLIPDKGLIVDREVGMIALQTKLGIDVGFDDNNNKLVLINGQVQKDEKTLQPIEAEVFIKDKLTALGLFGPKPNGNGEGDETGNGAASNYDKFVIEMEKQGKSTGSMDFNVEMNKRISEGTLKI